MVLKVIITLGIIGLIGLIGYFMSPRYRKEIANVGRIVVGLTFIFSGFVKGIDPLGFGYRLEDYFIAYNMNWAIPSALWLSIILCAFEFTLGVLLIANIRIQITAFLVALMMLGFTGLTFYDALYSPIPDCGCFGDAIKLTNWETFFKNIVLLLFLAPVMHFRKEFTATCCKKVQTYLAFGIYFVAISFSIYNYRHLPIIDFMSWKIGNKMFVENPQPAKYFLKYKNKKTGETKEYLSPNYPYNDSVWMSEWVFVDTRVEDPNKVVNLMIEGLDGNNYTDDFLRNPDYQLIATIPNLQKADKEAIKKLDLLYKEAKKENKSLIILTSGNPEDFKKVKKELGLSDSLNYYMADDIEQKIMVRSNPGLMLLKNGVVLDKWSHLDFPNYEELKNGFAGYEKRFFKKN